jgi:hypothetical protein
MADIELRIKVPKGIVEFAQDYAKFVGIDIDAFWRLEIIGAVNGLLHEIDGPYFRPEGIKERYGLTSAFGEKIATEM